MIYVNFVNILLKKRDICYKTQEKFFTSSVRKHTPPGFSISINYAHDEEKKLF